MTPLTDGQEVYMVGDDVTYLYTTMPDGSENTTTIPVDPWRSDHVG